MIDAILLREIRQEVRRQVSVILNGASGGTSDVASETIDNLLPGMPSLPDRPVIHPYGLSSRAPRDTLSVTARVGEHSGNRIILGHRDKNRPAVASGEVMLYNEFGEQIYLKDGQIILSSAEISLGSDSADEPLVLGNTLLNALTSLYSSVSSALAAIAGGPITLPGTSAGPTNPGVAGSLNALKSQIDSDKTTYLTDNSTNIVSQQVFTQRGGGA